ncbi:MAG: head-tail connector protein [Rhizomicrobium sp.]
MPLVLTAPPALEPVTLDEAKAHLKVDASDDDALIATLIAAARAKAEWHTGRAFVTQGWTLWLDRWPCADGVRLAAEIPLPPLQAVARIAAYGCDDGETVLDPSAYQVDGASGPARVALKTGAAMPADPRRLNAVAIDFTAGYGGDGTDVPAGVRAAILEIVAALYANRGDSAGELPLAALALLAPYRVVKI